MTTRLKAIILKEFRHILRDWQTLMIVLIMPIVMMFLYGYALNMELTEVPVAVIDPSLSTESSRIAASLDASPLFSVTHYQTSCNNPKEFFRTQRVKSIIRFPADFSPSFHRRSPNTAIQILIDGTDPNTATILNNTIEGVVRKILLTEITGTAHPQTIQMSSRVLYNPEQKSARFFVPGLMAVILLMISALLTSLTLTREKETGTLEQLLVSPLHPFEIVVGKIIPYCFIAACDGSIIVLVGQFIFGVHCSGSLFLLSLLSLLYILTSLAIGLVISTVARNQQQAMMIVLPVTMMPTIILSGFIFPLTGLPVFLRIISRFIPATWYLEIIRGIMLKGIGLTDLYKPALILASMAFLLTLIAVKRFRVRL